MGLSVTSGATGTPTPTFSPIPSTGVDGTSKTTGAPSSTPPPPAGERNTQPPPPGPVHTDPARTIAQRLDSLMVSAAKATVQSVGPGAANSALAGVDLDKKQRAALESAIKKAQDSMSKVSEFTGREIGKAFVLGKDGALDLKTFNSAARAVRSAISAQSGLSAILREIANNTPGLSKQAFDNLCDLAMKCDRRQTEIMALSIQLAEATLSGNDPDIAQHLDKKLTDLLPEKSVTMHGTGAALEKMKAELEPLAARMDAFAANPHASITAEELQDLTVAVSTAGAALRRAASEGFPLADGGRMIPDKDLLRSANELVSFAEQKLADTRSAVGARSINSFVKNVIGFPSGLPAVSAGNVASLKASAPTLVDIVAKRRALEAAALSYAANPSETNKNALRAALKDYRKTDYKTTQAMKAEIRKLMPKEGKVDKFGMTRSDWDRLSALLDNANAMNTQVQHLRAMVKAAAADKMNPEDFLTTSSARALVEGRLEFSTLVEARINGMEDSDVDPKLDDSRAVSSRTLGHGAANTVSLITYNDGTEYVFKPEAPGRQGMENLMVSIDYKPHEQVAHLNLATQDTAVALGAMDVLPKCSVGSHDGSYGLFMEKAPGMEADKFADPQTKPVPGHLTATQVGKLPPEQKAQVIGDLMRGLNRLEWLDIITGQGDRHALNYLIDVRPDPANEGKFLVSVTGIDNDQCFPAYRTGARVFEIPSDRADMFDAALESVAKLYDDVPSVLAKLWTDKAVTRLDGGAMRIDATQIRSGALYYAAWNSIGMHGMAMPEYIDEDMFNHLVALKKDNTGTNQARKDFLDGLAKRLPPEAAAAAEKRLDEAIAWAEQLAEAKLVVSADKFRNPATQRILQSAVGIVTPRKLVAGQYDTEAAEPPGSRVKQDALEIAQHQSQTLFKRDIFAAIS